MKLRHVLGLCPVLFALTSCEYSVMNKSDSEYLVAGDLLSIDNASNTGIKEEYLKALDSSDASVRGEAAYKVAKLAGARNDLQEYLLYLEMASENGHAKSQIELANAYVHRKPTKENLAKAKEIYLSEDRESANASLGLLAISKIEKNPAAAKQYSAQATSIFERKIELYGDFDGVNAIKLARLYDGEGNFKEADHWYRVALDKGNSKAGADLASMWRDNNLNADEAHKKEAFDLTLVAAQSGEKASMKYVAKSYATGYGVKLDKKEAISWYKKITEVHGDPTGSNARKIAKLNRVKLKNKKGSSGKNAIHNKDLNKAYEMLVSGDTQQKTPETYNKFVKLADNQKLLRAMIMVDTWNDGADYAYRSEYKKAGTKAVYSIVRLHAKKYAIAFTKMMYRQWELAADFGSNKAAYVVAENYSLISDQPFNNVETKKLYKRAADMGHGKAMLNMARRSLTDVSQENSTKNAFEWFLKAAQVDEVEGQYNTGLSYARGSGVEKNEEKSIYWLDKASKKGYKLATEALAALKSKENNNNDK